MSRRRKRLPSLSVVKKWKPQMDPGAMPIVPHVEPGRAFR
jgi:hypothetical protein